jgi:phospholipase C
MMQRYSSMLGLVAAALFGGRVLGDSLASIDHVVLFMQENRAFDHVRT